MPTKDEIEVFEMNKETRILEAFTAKCGTLEDWDNDLKLWLAMLGVFTLGWNAHEEHTKNGN